MKPTSFYNISRRLLFVILTPLWAFIIFVATILVLPYFIIYGTMSYDSKLVTGFNEWYLSLLN